MSHKQKRSSITRRPLFTILFLLLFVGAVFATIMIVRAINQSREEQGTAQNSQEDNKSGEKSKADSSNAKTDNKTPAQFEGNNRANQSESITGHINYAEKQGDTLRIRVTIDQVFGANGTCSLTIQQNGTVVYTAEAATETTAGSSTCQKAFDVPAKDLAGTYQIKITVTADDKSGIIEKEVAI